MTEPINMYIEKQGAEFVVGFESMELPESLAGMENVFDVKIINNTEYDLTNLKITSSRNDIHIKHADILGAKANTIGTITFECSKNEDGEYAEIPLKVTAYGRKRGA